MASLTLRGVHKTYDGQTHIIKGLDLEVERGEFVVFVGPSGCGKSTLLRMIAGLEDISSGVLEIEGQRANEVPAAKRGIAMVFQSYALYPHMSVYDNMGFALKMARIPPADIERAVHKAADVLGIRKLLARKPGMLSGGQRQRVAIGRAIVREPKVFLFDEPLSNLDAALRVQMRMELARLHKTLGTTMVYVTHDQVEAMTLGDRIAVFNEGKLEQIGAPADLYDRPRNAFVAEFLGSPKINMLPCSVAESNGPGCDVRLADGQRLTLPPGTLSALSAAPDRVAVRPDHWRISAEAGDIRVSVELVEHLGDAALLHTSTPDGSRICVKVAADLPRPQAGETVFLACAPGKALWFDRHGDAIPLGQ